MAQGYKQRRPFLNIIAFLLFFLIFVRLVKLQIVMGDDYAIQSENRLVSTETIEAPRGIIMDRNGKPIVTNRQGFAVEINKRDISYDEVNDIVLRLVNYFEVSGEQYVDTLPIDKTTYDFTYTGYESSEREERIAKFCRNIGVPEGTGGQDCIWHLAKEYSIDDRYTIDELRKIVGVRYEMQQRGFSASTPYTIASDVSINTVAHIKECADVYKNVKVKTRPVRNYMYKGVASHLLGRVGIIYKEEYETLKDENYGMNDMIGKEGLEKSLEKYLKGERGVKNTIRTIGEENGAIDTGTPALSGNNVVLTIDIDLQMTAEKALKDTIESIKKKAQEKGDGVGYDAGGGAVVVTDVKSGEILAMANYPTYDIETFDDNYESLLNNELKPFINRAISGIYAPGSVFKILTAIAGLEENVISRNEIIKDEGVYEYYGQKFNCWIWKDSHNTHGNVNVETAIQNSCNYYFYEVGKRLGWEKMYKYGKEYGLGEISGIELEGESKGVLANADYKSLNFDTPWYPGDDLQMAIGQSYNLFTPIQISNYIATVANGGTRYKPHLTKNIRNIYNSEILVSDEPVILNKVTMSDETHDAVTHGMRLVSDQDGTASLFANFPIEVCSKTGSAQVSRGSANGVFASYAPYSDPQISIAIVVENAGAGSALAPIAKTIYEKYFDMFGENELPDTDSQVRNTLIR